MTQHPTLILDSWGDLHTWDGDPVPTVEPGASETATYVLDDAGEIHRMTQPNKEQ